MTTNAVDTDYANHTAARFTERVNAVAEQLRRLADDVVREGRVRDHHGSPDFHFAAQNVAHTVTWGVANLNVPLLIDAATQAAAAHAAAQTD